MDIQNGTLLVQEDDATLEMVMINMYEERMEYEAMGVIIGQA
tara:strand:- start:455 stop:580 length:126 start_codon:yes stop_codon:yes gene_type:complete